MEPAFFHLGFSGADVWRVLSASGFNATLVRTYDVPYHVAVVESAPLSYRLSPYQPLQFRIRSNAFEKMAVVQGDNWSNMASDSGTFTIDMSPSGSGDMLVVGKKPGSDNYTAILGYVVSR
jgi:hypothetical protein